MHFHNIQKYPIILILKVPLILFLNCVIKITQSMNFNKRYGNLKKYRQQCAIAHKSTHGLCCVCMTRKSQEIHHAFYGNDIIGVSTYPVCAKCHQTICHSPENWIKDHQNPVWKNRNTMQFTQRLQLGYKLLYEGINHQ